MSLDENGKKPELVCPLCEVYKTKRRTNFETHLNDVHSTTTQKLWDQMNSGPKTCGCGCGGSVPWRSWWEGYGKFIIGHNANVYSSYDAETAKKLIQQRSDALKGTVSWAKGLTKETDERIKLRGEATSKGRKLAFEEGELEIWSKGLTKETDERLMAKSIEYKERHASGDLKIWHKGLTEETDERVLAKNNSLRQRYRDKQLTPWHAGQSIATDDRLKKIWINRNATEEYKHIRRSDEDIEKLLEMNTQIRLNKIEKYQNQGKPALWMTCTKCDWSEKVSLNFARGDRCPKCYVPGSAAQRELTTWIEDTFKCQTLQNVRGLIGKMLEIDIFIPAKKFAVEYNGLYWHTEAAGKDKEYHWNKTRKCSNIGLDLVHIFEDEWLRKRPIVENMFKLKLDPTLLDQTIDVNDCKIIYFPRALEKKFFNENHLEGMNTTAVVSWGLFKGDVLLAALSVRKSPYKKHKDLLEVTRFCTKLGYDIPKAFELLIHEALRYSKNMSGISGILYHHDLRFGQPIETVYTALGFDKGNLSDPPVWWTDQEQRYDRAKKNVFDKIWGCPKREFVIRNG